MSSSSIVEAVPAAQQEHPTLVVVGRSGEMEVSASTPEEMIVANQALIVWCDKKIEEVKQELAEVTEARDRAKKNKWNSTALTNQVRRIGKRIQFFDKMKKCLEHGYYIVPNFPVTAFVVRTKAFCPAIIERGYRIGNGDTEHKPGPLPIGEGEYENPFQSVYSKTIGPQVAGGKTETRFFTEGNFEEIEFPLNMAKPHIMCAVERAMALKIFDDIGILPDPSPKKKDPIIVGRIYDNPTTYHRVPLTFMISWHLDTRAL